MLFVASAALAYCGSFKITSERFGQSRDSVRDDRYLLAQSFKR
jgi:hypothetical protein